MAITKQQILDFINSFPDDVEVKDTGVTPASNDIGKNVPRETKTDVSDTENVNIN